MVNRLRPLGDRDLPISPSGSLSIGGSSLIFLSFSRSDLAVTLVEVGYIEGARFDAHSPSPPSPYVRMLGCLGICGYVWELIRHLLLAVLLAIDWRVDFAGSIGRESRWPDSRCSSSEAADGARASVRRKEGPVARLGRRERPSSCSFERQAYASGVSTPAIPSAATRARSLVNASEHTFPARFLRRQGSTHPMHPMHLPFAYRTQSRPRGRSSPPSASGSRLAPRAFDFPLCPAHRIRTTHLPLSTYRTPGRSRGIFFVFCEWHCALSAVPALLATSSTHRYTHTHDRSREEAGRGLPSLLPAPPVWLNLAEPPSAASTEQSPTVPRLRSRRPRRPSSE
ncbi:hypothetical protein HETIRDRAFT_108184 [Heterobasidion irregulare TC 32-1]|uniref:Uncharacterized protein n=1 Tax=Heterobasidion irregulare (strain TC 32-1) TaxID=747525 RepID=W4JNS2_HETIT|nr:uncharacterized protein HETIRDRAFT_108184 [Heterobasidion irregulare TC 32-1]ETW75207.1 hypothetical protein HETIRDRAFT_108184 [Heterobasidion irregulare TC 32-1]